MQEARLRKGVLVLGMELTCNYVKVKVLKSGKLFKKLCRREIGGDFFLGRVRVDLCKEHAAKLGAEPMELDVY